ncbi:MAG: hypothetical protein U0R26_10160 [Solirubrobacterales bacterium]
MDGAGSPECNPQHAVVIDGHAVRPDLLIREIEEATVVRSEHQFAMSKTLDDELAVSARYRRPRGSSNAGPLEIVRPSTTQVALPLSIRYRAACVGRL